MEITKKNVNLDFWMGYLQAMFDFQVNDWVKQYGTDYGLKALQAELAAGQTQRDIEQQGLTADYGQYLREFQYPQEQLTKYGEALKTVPAYTTFASNVYGQVPGTAAAAATSASDLVQMLKNLKII